MFESGRRFLLSMLSLIRSWLFGLSVKGFCNGFRLLCRLCCRSDAEWRSALETISPCIGPNPSLTGSPSAIRLTLTPRTHSSGAISGQPFPNRAPCGFAPFTRWIPAARSGLKRPQSDASLARRRTAARRTLIVDGAGLLCSSEKRFRAVWLCILSATSHICGLLRREPQYETATRGDKIAVFRSLK